MTLRGTHQHRIGFGDIVPSSKESRLFTIFFALAGICIVGVGLGEVGVSAIGG